MLVMRTTEDPTDSVGEFISTQQPIGLDHLALAVYPFGLYGVQPRTLFRQKAAYDPHSSFAAALLNLTVMFSEPSSHLAAYVPGSVVPDENQHLSSCQPLQGFRSTTRETVSLCCSQVGHPRTSATYHRVRADRARSKRGPSARDRLWRPSAG